MRPCCGLNPLCSSIIISVFYIPLIIPLLVPSAALSFPALTPSVNIPNGGAASRVLIESGASNSSCISKQQRWMWNIAPRNELINQPLHGDPVFLNLSPLSVSRILLLLLYNFPTMCSGVIHFFGDNSSQSNFFHFLTFVSLLVSFFDSLRSECLIRACRRFICSRRTYLPEERAHWWLLQHN